MVMSLVVDYASVDGNERPGVAGFKRAFDVGVRTIVVRSSYSNWNDPTDERDDDDIIAAGIVFGAYMFPVLSVGAPAPSVQVATFKAGTRQLTRRDLPPVLDIEFPGGIAKTGRTRKEIVVLIRAFIRELYLAFGVMPILYTSGRVWNTNDSDALGNPPAPDLIDCPLWLARYPYAYRQEAHLNDLGHEYDPPVPHPWGNAWTMHQHQGDALHMEGFNKTVDLGRFRIVRPGDTGDQVRLCQRRLGMAEGTPGLYDEAMRDAVITFQKNEGLVADGIIGPRTFAPLAWSHPPPTFPTYTP